MGVGGGGGAGQCKEGRWGGGGEGVSSYNLKILL